MNITNLVLPEDLDEANKILIWAEYCHAQMAYCLQTFNLEGIRHWNLEYQRSVNDLNFLRFKKIDKERVIFDERV